MFTWYSLHTKVFIVSECDHHVYKSTTPYFTYSPLPGCSGNAGCVACSVSTKLDLLHIGCRCTYLESFTIVLFFLLGALFSVYLCIFSYLFSYYNGINSNSITVIFAKSFLNIILNIYHKIRLFINLFLTQKFQRASD